VPVVVAVMEFLATAGQVIAGILSVLAAVKGLFLLWGNIKQAK
jgi:hypothetical protein